MSINEGLTSYEDNTNYKAIACERIPELFLDKIVAKKYFGKFGKIKRFILRPNRLSCTIEYENEEDAKNALLNSGSFNGIDFIVKYAEHEEAHVQNTEEWVDPEVQAELEAMSPGHRMDTALRPTLLKSNVSNRIHKPTNSLSFSPKVNRVAAINRQNSPQPEVIKIDAVVRQELEAVLKTPAYTDEEKYRVLDARDKLIRLTTVRQTDIKKAVATKGTCPDMCPEKERLMREFQRQVSIYEMADDENSESKISHKKAIKEYSRSSADQEVPLSHELRSESVLKMTMLYLVHCIMGLCDDPKTSLCDWFHFVWDRTRSIRKDITQQELCSLGAVELVEQCARFHIHCAARLVAEDPSVFDKKINAENLTKCLQTLKYMYHDLRIKGVVCPCEQEFRSYVILLNLGDSNFLWELKQLPESIQKSAEIKRAIAFYNALQNNNFVKFFSMIKSSDTSYLSACILLGYFTKLRKRAMDAIVKSHNWRKNDVYLPLSYLSNVLGFDDEASAESFFNHYGLQCDIVDKRVLLDRLIKPNIEYAMDRALQLVESKRQVSVGECVFGQRLPSASLFENHQPQNSFDDNGMFKMELLSLDERSAESFTKPKVQLRHQQRQLDTNVTTENETNLFKMPQSISEFSPKQQRKPNLQKEQNTAKENEISSLDPLAVKKEEQSPCPVEFKFTTNIFGKTTDTESSKESIFKAAVFNAKPEETQPNFFNSIFKPFAENPLPTTGNIFGGHLQNAQSKSNNIFSTAARETANIFQQQKDISNNISVNEKSPKTPQRRTETPFFSIPSTKVVENVPEFKIEQSNKSGAADNEMGLKNDAKLKEEMEKLEELKRLKEQKLQEDQERIEKLKAILEEKAVKSTEIFISQLVEEEVFKLAQTEILIAQNIEKASDLCKEELLIEVVETCVEDIANEEYALMCFDRLLLNRYFTKWLMHLRKKREQRKLIENSPLWVSSDTRAQFAEAVKHPSQQENMEMIQRYRFGQPYDLSKLFNSEWEGLRENPINLFALVGQHLLAKQNFTSCGLLQQKNYFKFLITLPGNKEELLGFENFSNRCLSKIIEKSQTDTAGPFVLGIEHNFALCVRKLNGIIPKNEQGSEITTEGDHSDGVVCFITGVDIETHSRKRLHNLLKLSSNFKRLPLAIIAYNCSANNEELARLLDLDILQEEGLIYSYIILGCQTKRRNFNFRKLMINAVDFITNESFLLNSNDVQALAMQNVLSFLETSLGEEIWQRWCRSANLNPIFNKICNLPQHVLGIYHKALDHLLNITQEDFDEMPEFPEELKDFVPDNSCFNVPLGLEFFPSNWKDKTGKKVIKKFLQSLYLPQIEEQYPADLENLKLWLLKYTGKLINDDEFAAAKASHEAITSLINQIKLFCVENVEVSSSMRMINYLTVFKPIIYAHTNRMLKQYSKELINLKVIYLKDDLRNYQTQPWWLNYEPLNQVTVDYNEGVLTRPLQTQQLGKNQSLVLAEDIVYKIIAEAEESSCKAEENISEYKRKKQINNSNPMIDLSVTSQLKRTLDDSLYRFELSKKVGEYDTSFVNELTQNIDKSINEVLSQSSISKKKRKSTYINSSTQHADVDSVIAKATKIIQSVESAEDNKLKAKFVRTDQVKL